MDDFAVTRSPWTNGPQVSSEGYECWIKDAKKPEDRIPLADQSPISDAASQLAAAYLGFITNRRSLREKARERSGREIYVSVLVTTAQLKLLDHKWETVSLMDGKPPDTGELTDVNWVILKHPFPTPEGVAEDFRDSVGGDDLPRKHSETIYIVQATKVCEFLNTWQFEEWADC